MSAKTTRRVVITAHYDSGQWDRTTITVRASSAKSANEQALRQAYSLFPNAREWEIALRDSNEH